MTHQEGERRAPTPKTGTGGTNWDIYPTHFVNGGRDLAREIKTDPLKGEVYPLFRKVILARLQASVTAASLVDHQKVPGRNYHPESLLNSPGFVGWIQQNHEEATSRRDMADSNARIFLEMVRPELQEPYQEIEVRFNRLVMAGLLDMKEQGFDPGKPIYHRMVGGSLIELVNFNLGGAYVEPEN